MAVKTRKKMLDILQYLMVASFIFIVITDRLVDKQIDIGIIQLIGIVLVFVFALNGRLNEIEKKLEAIENTTSKS